MSPIELWAVKVSFQEDVLGPKALLFAAQTCPASSMPRLHFHRHHHHRHHHHCHHHHRHHRRMTTKSSLKTFLKKATAVPSCPGGKFDSIPRRTLLLRFLLWTTAAFIHSNRSITIGINTRPRFPRQITTCLPRSSFRAIALHTLTSRACPFPHHTVTTT